MAPVKRCHTRSHHKMKLVRRTPKISELVYKYLRLDEGKEDDERLSLGSVSRCSFCKRQKRREEVLDSADSRPGENMANKRKEPVRNSKIHRAKRQQTSRDQTLSACMHKGNGGEGLREMKRYIQKAIDFGVESGYLIPKDASYKVLRVSSGLLNDVNYASNVRRSGGRVSHAKKNVLRQTPSRLDEYEVQDARRRRSSRRRSRKRRRSRSGSRRRRKSRRRGRRRSGSATGEEVIDIENDNDNENDNENDNDNDNDNESEFEMQPQKRSNTENVNRDEADEQPNQSDREKTSDKAGDDDATDLSIDEDESDDEGQNKGKDANKS